MANSKILVTGATGAVGPRVVTALIDAGYQVRTLSLDSPPLGIWPKGVESLKGDVTDPNAVQSAMMGVDTVIHMAALLHIVNPSTELKDKYEKVNVGGTATVTQIAIKENVKRILYFSTIAVYGESGGQILDERTTPKPNTFYENTKLAAEKIILDAKRSDGQPLGTVLRMGAVYGSRIKGNYRQLLKALAKGRFIPIGRGQNRRTLIYDRDVARAAVLAAEHPAAAGKIFNVTDGQFHTLNEIIAVMCRTLGRRCPRISVPVAPVQFAVGVLEDSARLLGRKFPIGRATIDKYTEDIAVDGSLIQKELGFVPQYDLRAGWEETIREMRETNSF